MRAKKSSAKTEKRWDHLDLIAEYTLIRQMKWADMLGRRNRLHTEVLEKYRVLRFTRTRARKEGRGTQVLHQQQDTG